MKMKTAAITALCLFTLACQGMPIPIDQNALDIASKAWEKKDAIMKTGKALRKGFSDLTDQEEHYIGRSVAAKILSQYKYSSDSPRTVYINTLGSVLAKCSARPQTFSGYHFLLIESKEVNAFAAPGGFIFVTTGLFSQLKSEEELAAVLAHEIAHVTLKHGLSAIKAANLTQAFTILGTEAAKEYGSQQVAQLTTAFEGSIDDIVNQLVVNGYSRSQEYDADGEALRIVARAGYDPAGLTGFLKTLDGMSKGGSGGFFKTHPPASGRLQNAQGAIKSEDLKGSEEKVRSARFLRYAMK